MNHFRLFLPLFVIVLSGCNSDLPALDHAPQDSPSAIGKSFDPARTGRIEGQVTWTGPIPNPPPFLYGVPRADGAGFEFRTAENPNRPRVDPKSKAVNGAVVFLREVDTHSSRPWDLPPVRVEIGNGQITVIQGESRGRAGFVRRGDSVSASSTESNYQVLRGRGEAFFSLPLPEANRPVSRTLSNSGRVELSSGTGLYWSCADLFVADHPYYATTDADGRFTLDRVPTGKFEVVVWHPRWETAKTERDPDSTQIARLTYAAPIERVTTVLVEPSRPVQIKMTLP